MSSHTMHLHLPFSIFRVTQICMKKSRFSGVHNRPLNAFNLIFRCKNCQNILLIIWKLFCFVKAFIKFCIRIEHKSWILNLSFEWQFAECLWMHQFLARLQNIKKGVGSFCRTKWPRPFSAIIKNKSSDLFFHFSWKIFTHHRFAREQLEIKSFFFCYSNSIFFYKKSGVNSSNFRNVFFEFLLNWIYTKTTTRVIISIAKFPKCSEKVFSKSDNNSNSWKNQKYDVINSP